MHGTGRVNKPKWYHFLLSTIEDLMVILPDYHIIGNYMFKVSNVKLEQGVNYVQS